MPIQSRGGGEGRFGPLLRLDPPVSRPGNARKAGTWPTAASVRPPLPRWAELWWHWSLQRGKKMIRHHNLRPSPPPRAPTCSSRIEFCNSPKHYEPVCLPSSAPPFGECATLERPEIGNDHRAVARFEVSLYVVPIFEKSKPPAPPMRSRGKFFLSLIQLVGFSKVKDRPILPPPEKRRWRDAPGLNGTSSRAASSASAIVTGNGHVPLGIKRKDMRTAWRGREGVFRSHLTQVRGHRSPSAQPFLRTRESVSKTRFQL